MGSRHLIQGIYFIILFLMLTFDASAIDISGCTNLDQDNGVYDLTSAISGSGTDYCINVSANNVTLDCHGRLIDGNDNAEYGVYISGVNATVRNCVVRDWSSVNIVVASNGNRLDNITSISGVDYGITVSGQYNVLTNITSTTSEVGILVGGDYNNFTGLTVSSSAGPYYDDDGICVTGDYNYFRDVLTKDNNGNGLTLESFSSYNTFINLTATGNAADSSSYGGIYLRSGGRHIFHIVNSSYNDNAGIRLYGDNGHNNFSEVIVSHNEYEGIFLYMYSAHNNFVNVTAESNGYNGVRVERGSYSNNFTNMYLYNCSASGESACIKITGYETQYDIAFRNVTINTSAWYGIWFDPSADTEGTVFQNLLVTDVSDYDVYLEQNAPNTTFLNATYDDEEVGTGSSLIRRWYYRTYVNDTYGNPVHGAEITAYNSSDELIENLTSSTDGWTGLGSLIEYVNDAGTLGYYSNYTIYADRFYFHSVNHTYNVTANTYDDSFTLDYSVTMVDDCMVLNESGVYVMAQNITAAGPGVCINVSAENVTLDCQDHRISNTSLAAAGVYSNQYNTTLKDCRVTMASANGGYGIQLISANSSQVLNCTLDSNSIGLLMDDVHDSVLDGLSANDNTYSGLTIHSSGNNLVRNAYVNGSLCGVTVNGSAAKNASDNLFRDSVITYPCNYSVCLLGYASNTTFLNVTYDNDTVGTGSLLTRKWYFEMNVTELLGYPVKGANVTAWDDSGGELFSEFANSTGHIALRMPVEYWRNSSNTVYLSPYTVNTTKAGYVTNSTVINLSTNVFLGVVLELPTNVTICGVLNKPDTTYSVTADVVPPGPGNCFIVTAENVTLDCLGHSISNRSLAKTGVYSSQPHTTVRNCRISMNESNGGNGIYIYNANYSRIINNTLNYQYYGLYLYLTSNTTVDRLTAENNSKGICFCWYYTTTRNYFNTLTNITVRNNSFYGIQTAGVYNSTFTDVTADNNNYGLYLESGTYNTFTNVTTNNNGVTGLYIATNGNNISHLTSKYNNNGLYMKCSYNTVYDADLGSNGIYGLYVYGRNNSITETTFTNCSWGGSYSCIRYYVTYMNGYTDYNTLTNVFINGSSNHGIWLYGDPARPQYNISENVFRNVRIMDVDGFDVILQQSAINNRFINATYSSENVTDDKNSLIRKWYYRAYANDSSGNTMPNTNVSAYNRTGELAEQLWTGASGWTPLGELVDYVNNNGTIITYYSPYTIYAVNDSWLPESHDHNVTMLQNIYENVFTFNNDSAPDTPTPTINSSSGGNLTIDDLDCHTILTDPDNDTMNVTVRWYLDGGLNLTVEYEGGYGNGTDFNAVLDSGNTSDSETWRCSIRLFDGTEYSGWGNSTDLLLEDLTPPTIEFKDPTTAEGNYTQDWIAANVSAEDERLDTITVYLYNETDVINITASSSPPVYINYTGLAEGLYHLNATVNDSGGFDNSTETRTYFLQTPQSPGGGGSAVRNVKPKLFTQCPVKLKVGVPQNITVRLDNRGGAVILNADVTAYLGDDSVFENKTNTNGAVTFTPKKPGKYEILVSKPGYRLTDCMMETVKKPTTTTTLKTSSTTATTTITTMSSKTPTTTQTTTTMATAATRTTSSTTTTTAPTHPTTTTEVIRVQGVVEAELTDEIPATAARLHQTGGPLSVIDHLVTAATAALVASALITGAALIHISLRKPRTKGLRDV